MRCAFLVINRYGDRSTDPHCMHEARWRFGPGHYSVACTRHTGLNNWFMEPIPLAEWERSQDNEPLPLPVVLRRSPPGPEQQGPLPEAAEI
jgi:hypothetical protein